MKKIISKIFLCLCAFPIIYSKCKNEGQSETNAEKCFSSINEKYPDYCCLFKREDGAGFCKTVPYSSLYKAKFKEYINDILYEVECNPDSNFKAYTLERCGNIYNNGNPSKKECKKYSTYVNSCCYFSGKNNDDDPEIEGKDFVKGCYWLGSKYEGSIFWAGARLECSCNFLKYSLFSILYLIILL